MVHKNNSIYYTNLTLQRPCCAGTRSRQPDHSLFTSYATPLLRILRRAGRGTLTGFWRTGNY
jgi:hypothetical protein